MQHYARHKFFYKLIKIIVTPFFKGIYRYKYQKAAHIKPPFIVVSNHNNDLDPALVSMALKEHIYYVASEHIFRWGRLSKLIVWLFAPIMRQKGTADARTVMDIIRHVRAGHNIGLFAEGNRSFNGLTGPILPSTGKMVKLLGARLVTFKLEGGYFTSPRWGDRPRKGRMRGYVVNIYTPEALKGMSAGDVQTVIERDLYEDANATQKQNPIAYKGKNLACHLETALYMCPLCRAVASMHSRGNQLMCACGLRVACTPYGGLIAEYGSAFKTVAEWDIWQKRTLATLIHEDAGLTISDEGQELYSVIPGKSGTLLETGRLSLDAKGLGCGGFYVHVEDISDMAIYGRMTIVFSTARGGYYEIKSKGIRSALKYYDYYQIIKKGGEV
ncbi:MAG: 1-acyl-sn-glycerol-3-phosphate acyltransferase [Clostridiales bacterium]|jgi:1-acyl-sn-glycerol-3-phosphate acyltransferase|nr:1-acyl-sn-glycerol-3-phosphate acyltransferase [Clostridiales bacterium]